jgi:hypothetical protein
VPHADQELKCYILDDYLLEIEPFRKANDTMTNDTKANDTKANDTMTNDTMTNDMGKKMYFNIETQTKNKNKQTQIKNLLEQIQKT